jgi:error-prone DNA polymerase
VFACSLLNAQPMGFYTPATIIEDAKRHDVDFLPIDVLRSVWHCTLEEGSSSPCGVRMGLRYVKGLSRGAGERIEAVRCQRPFVSVEDFASRTGLDEGSVTRLAEAGALSGLQADRRGALWEAQGASRTSRSSLGLQRRERTPRFEELDAFESIGWDYRAAGHSTRGHPLEPLREALRERRLPDARSVNAMKHGRRVRYAGLVICRQRPGTASGVVFMTLEDETGFVNVVVWSPVFEEQRLLIKTSSFLGVTGKLQVQQGATHLVAEKFWTPRLKVAPPGARSRDFH